MDIITIDGMVENDFRQSIEDMLRLDQVDEAVDRARDLLDCCAGEGKILPARFLQVTADDLEIGGWHRLKDRLLDHGRSSFPITAIGVTLADARQLGGPGPNGGRLKPFIKTFYFTDDAYPFSEASRDDLLDGYSRDGFELQGDYRATDATLSVRGIDDLYGAIVELEARLFDLAEPDEEEIRAGSIGSCFLAALIHQALRDTIRRKGLPRPLCVFAACDGVYPFFDAPVIGSDECPVTTPPPSEEAAPAEAEVSGAGEDEEDEDDDVAEEPAAEASLLTLGIRRAGKAPVMVLDAAEAEEAARASEQAGALRMGVVDEHLQREVLDHGEILYSESDLEVLDRPEDYDQPVAAAADLEREAGLEPLDRIALAEESREADQAAVPPLGEHIAEPEAAASWEFPVAEHRDEFFPAEIDEPVAPAPPPPSHSLRARLKAAQPEQVPSFGARLMAAASSIWRMIAGG